MRYLAAIIALVVAAAGWFYLFYSRAAHELGDFEDPRLNQRRIRLRRFGALLILLLAGFFFAGFFTVSWERPTPAFALVWLVVFILMAIILVLAMIDLRLTLQIRRRRHNRDSR